MVSPSRLIPVICIGLLILSACSASTSEPQAMGNEAGPAVAYALQIGKGGMAEVSDINLATGDAKPGVAIPSNDAPSVHPDSVVASNGEQLIVAHTDTSGQELRAFDAETGTVLDTEPISDLIANQMPMDYMFARGSRVFIYQSNIVGEASSEQRISTYDVASQSILPETIPLGGCNAVAMVATLSESRLAVYCGLDREVRLITTTERGGVSSEHSLTLPLGSSSGLVPDPDTVVSLTASPDGAMTYIVTRRGDIYGVNSQSVELEISDNLPIPDGTHVNFKGAASFADGSELIITTGDSSQFDPFLANHITRVSAGDWKVLATTDLPQPGHDLLVTAERKALMFASESSAILEASFDDGDSTEVKSIALPSGLPMDLEARPSSSP